MPSAALGHCKQHWELVESETDTNAHPKENIGEGYCCIVENGTLETCIEPGHTEGHWPSIHAQGLCRRLPDKRRNKKDRQ